MKTIAHADLLVILAAHKKYLNGETGGERANLRSADLSYANLSSANLRSADLSYADLRYADLSYADLRYANLRSANLRSADLSYANLSSANLRSADLSSANLSSAVLSDGVRWDEYLRDLVPALLMAGGKALTEVATPETWACHSWGSDGNALGCPMAVAFNVTTASQIPALHRWQAERFVQLFDAMLIPMPEATP